MSELEQLPWVWQALIGALLVVGGLFALVGAIGLVRFRDFYMRLHAPTKATTLGVGGLLLAALVAGAALGRPTWAELLITLFIFVSAPVSANLLAQAALHRREPSVAPPPPEQPRP